MSIPFFFFSRFLRLPRGLTRRRIERKSRGWMDPLTPIRDTIVSYFNRLWIIARRRGFTEREEFAARFILGESWNAKRSRLFITRLFILEGKKINWPFLRNRIVKFKKNYPRTGEKTTQYGMVESWRDNWRFWSLDERTTIFLNSL